ncbi:methyltransferase domain-containing protein [Candidatus Woesearchaeota archaeon]|nr:methyltransferase domain-containing protein [Candidatus Woesearchaeota archaeon]
MEKMNQINAMQKKWIPDMPVSKGAEGYHNAVIGASWNVDNINELIAIIKPDIDENDIVVDFGAGTGASAISILEQLDAKISLWLVDNSPAWLAKAYEILGKNPNVSFFILGKKDGKYGTLDKTIGKNAADMVISANTFHLVPDLENAFSGIFRALKSPGKFVFQSGNISRQGMPKDVLMIEDTIHSVHDIALGMINSNPMFEEYKAGISERIVSEIPQRKFVFPSPRDMDVYLEALNHAGFQHENPVYKKIRVKYADWMNFLRVRRLQAGILPEIGGRYPSPKEERDRDAAIVLAAKQLFRELEEKNSLADSKSFAVEWAYIKCRK